MSSCLHRFPTHLAVILLLSPWCVCLSATLLHPAGNSSFTTSVEESSFWSSDAGNYTFGFKAIDGGGEDYLLSIWHSLDPNKTAIWWVASAAPLKAGATLLFSSSGSLDLYNASQHSNSALLLWSSNTSSSYAALQDTGNLVLLESNKENMSWQSFDQSGESLMLVAGLDALRVSNKPYLLQSRRNESSYAPGAFHVASDADLNLYFHALDAFGNDFIYLYANINISSGFYIGRQYGNQYTSPAQNEIKRLALDYDGNVRVYMWESNVSAWKAVWQMLDDKCMLGSPCGPFAICTETDGNKNGINCSCPPGYHPRKDNDMLAGCQASVSFNASCGTGHASNYTATIDYMPNSDYDYSDLQSQANVNIEQCKQLCLDNCACIAASFRSDGTCFLKGNSSTGYLLNGYTSNSSTLLIKVSAIESNDSSEQKQGRHWVIGVGVAVALALLVITGLSAWLVYRRRRRNGTSSRLPWRRTRGREKHAYEVTEEIGPVRFYRFEDLLHATCNFSEKLGEGGFGIVYKGWIKTSQNGRFQQIDEPWMVHNNASALAVAVKVLKTSSNQYGGGDGAVETQFRAEVRTLGKIHHVNLVSLLGYCFKAGRVAEERMLVYEYLENGSLDKFLQTEPFQQLAWGVRFSIALGAARGVAYLHHECSPPILHCDIKPHNILLDAHFIPKISDFGFATCFNVDSHIAMSGIRGTRGYLAPEWLTAQSQLTSKVDVYSFGMLLLELVRGFKAVDDRNLPLVEWASKCVTMGAVLVPELDTIHQDQSTGVQQEAADQKLRMLKVGIWCIQHNPSMRPTMLRVVQLIEGTLALEDPPVPPSTSDVIFQSISSGPSNSHPSSSTGSIYNNSFSAVTAGR